ncbi:Poly(A)-specific ribonuclease PARN [Colletotrichum sidae]|uniref:Poly(A)-specific ribonuclease PARN n=1 Tax=Colletotrichum sidae TaxID=1347389 RepID=A0A4R8TSX3_9PEZI|nr:Poly(A)-specific ribonuclease PARN [Colletotrichum sidae]
MEVSMNNFWRMLPKILISIAEADFVAFDVEMTGISDKLSEAAYSRNNQTRQHIYEHSKRIASTFNLFQFGFTCLTAQRDGSYSTKSFSFNVSPLLIEDTREDEFFAQDIGRNLTVSLNALKFLRREGQQLEKIFSNPVPYLSRKEIREARERLESRKTPRVLRDHQYNEDEEGLNFFSAYVFDAISTWLDDRSDDKPSDIKISIPPADSKKRASVYHKIVRTAAQNMVPFMKCRTRNYGATVLIYIEGFDEESERVKTAGDRLDASIKKQKGIGIVIEALAGGDFAHEIDPRYIIDALSSWPASMSAKDFCRLVQRKFNTTPEQRESEDASGSEYYDSEDSDAYSQGPPGFVPGDEHSPATMAASTLDDHEP